jgi:hypothetical protein
MGETAERNRQEVKSKESGVNGLGLTTDYLPPSLWFAHALPQRSCWFVLMRVVPSKFF